MSRDTEFKDAVKKFKAIREIIQPAQRWMHVKSGGMYTVRDIVMLEDSLTAAVQYVGDNNPDIPWVRPATEFNDRFVLVSDYRRVVS